MDSNRKKIMLVDDTITNLTVGRNALSPFYDVMTIPSGLKLISLLQKTIPDLILLDIEMPDMSGYEVIKILKGNEATSDIPVIFLTSHHEQNSELEGLALGAIDYITKPFSPRLLQKRIEVHLLVAQQQKELKNYNDNLKDIVKEKTRTVIELQSAILSTMSELVECRDDVTGGHIERTQHYLSLMLNGVLEAKVYAAETASWNIDFLLPSAQLHDVGKISIRDSVLLKPGSLTEEELEEIKKHPLYGVQIIDKIARKTTEQDFLNHARIFAGTHHEKWDGSGYPYGLKGLAIPLQGRLMAIADVYDALTSERPYKKAFSHKEAVNMIKEGRGTHFDPLLVDIFLKKEGEFADYALSLKTSL